MTVIKRTVSIDADVAEQIAKAAEEDGMSFSAWLTTEAEHALRLREGLQAVAEWEAENGPFTPEEIAEGRARAKKILNIP
jgi:hypothetical protein